MFIYFFIMNIQYYLIHGVDKARGPRMMEEFKK